jgi:hypothetical protein
MCLAAWYSYDSRVCSPHSTIARCRSNNSFTVASVRKHRRRCIYATALNGHDRVHPVTHTSATPTMATVRSQRETTTMSVIPVSVAAT